MTAARRGIALLATIVAISLLGVLALAGMRLARARQVGARRLVAGHAATLGAARALDSALATARAWDWALLPVGRRTILLDLAGRERIAVERASETLFRLDAAVARGDALAPARHAASIVVAADLPRLDVGAPLVSAGPVEIER
ncbi:MAG TPA: hypothetical protein VEA99_12955, partial [Gemmatimonadaceae bacterium]|nr:hypothetical protein [Gemmatimonadaceae bacterium]